MALTIGDTAPDFEADTTEGRINFHDWLGDSWAVLFSHPRDFTPVCTTELGYMANIKPEFDRRGVKIIGLSIDPLDNHERWAKDIEETQGTAPNYPLIGDPEFKVAKAYGMLAADVEGDPTERTPADNQTVRNVFVIGPDKKIKLVLVYPMTTGRNFDEVLRVIDSLQLTANHKVATPGAVAAGRRRDHRRLGERRAGEGDLRRLGVAEALHQDRAAAERQRQQQLTQSPAPGSRSFLNDAAGSGAFSSSWFSFIQAENSSHCPGSCQPNGLPSGGKKSGSVTFTDARCSFGSRSGFAFRSPSIAHVRVAAKGARPA